MDNKEEILNQVESVQRAPENGSSTLSDKESTVSKSRGNLKPGEEKYPIDAPSGVDDTRDDQDKPQIEGHTPVKKSKKEMF